MDVKDERQIERLTGQLSGLTEIAKTLTLPLELPELLTVVLEKIARVLIPAEYGVIMLWDQSSGLFRTAACYGFNYEIMKRLGLRSGEAITGKVYDNDKAWLLSTPDEVANAMADMRPANRRSFIQALGSENIFLCSITAPIAVGDQKFGVLILETLHGPNVFTQEDISFVQTLADLIALAIDRARLEDKADAIRAVREADRMRAELMATLSHELRMPLTSIKGYATALQLNINWNEEKVKSFLHKIDEECDNLQGMIKDILDSSLIDVDQINLELQPVRLQNIARDVTIETQRHTNIHSLMLEFPPDCPIVNADARWIRQVFRNILENAIKYSPDGGLIVIRGEVRAADVVVSVSDQGIGISPEDLIPLFEKFFRVKSAAGLHVAGTGLGLPVARAIVEAHGGKIWAESKLDEGTTIYFSLPKADLMLKADE
jgi:K+-sensing histidine kinase KdpD